MRATRLLAQARSLYDAPATPFAAAARSDGWRAGFASGAAWMRLVLAHLRSAPLQPVDMSFNRLGVIKYGLAGIGAALTLALIVWVRWWALLPAVVLVFYLIEAEMVFLFPLAIDGSPSPWAASLALTARAGGAVSVMATVLPIAAVMLFGGLLGRGFLRCWALGCMAVLIWYEEVRDAGHRVA